jgi:hypothetical protein
MGECPFSSHQLEANSETGSNFEKMTLACGICGVGHTFQITWTGRDQVRVDTTISPAHGAREISRDVIRWSIEACEGTIRNMEQDRVTVIRGRTDIQGEPAGL